MATPKKTSIGLAAPIGSLFVVDIFLGLWAIHKYWFVSLSVGAASPLVIGLYKRRSPKGVSTDVVRPTESSADRIVNFFLDKIPAYLGKRRVSVPILLGLALPIVPLTYLILVPKLPFPAPPSAVAISKDGREIYVAFEDGEIHGKLLIFDAETGKGGRGAVDIGGKPHRMIVGKDGRVFVVDDSQDSVSVVDPVSRTVVETFSVHPFHLPHTLVLSPDERKLYIAVAEPTPQGVIKVIDLDKSKGYPSHSIEGVNCPEGMAISQDGGKVYVASQCGAGQDPVFAIDTKTEIVKPIPGFAVGLDLAIARKGKRLYVARGGFSRRDPDSGVIVPVPARLVPSILRMRKRFQKRRWC
jgi:DNA-binding beta-propeller fold protein YncE